MIQIAPSVLSADFLNLGRDIEIIDKSADILHLDVMDGTFVPNISFGFPVVEAISKIAEKPLDVHLMIVHPEKYVERFADAGASMISFHLEAVADPMPILSQIHSKGVKAGLVINPDIPVETLFPYLRHCDFVLIMSVFAGFGGQKFIPESIDKIIRLKDEIRRQGLRIPIEVDGGVGTANAAALVEAGAEILVAGSFVFKTGDPASQIEAIRCAAQ